MYLQNKYTKCYYSIIDRAKSRVLLDKTYTEIHHIIPKALGGSNSKDNLVVVTGKEHRLLHILLPKMTITAEHTKSMWYAAWMILRTKNKHQNRTVSNGKAYELAKMLIAKYSSQLHKGKTVSKETREKLSKSCQGRESAFKGKSHSKESKQKLSTARKGKTNSPETVAKILESRQHYRHSIETRRKISESQLGKIVVVSDKTRKNISNSLKGRVPTWLKGKPGHSKGKPRTDETKNKLRIPKPKFTCPHCDSIIGGQSNYNRWHGENCKKIN